MRNARIGKFLWPRINRFTKSRSALKHCAKDRYRMDGSVDGSSAGTLTRVERDANEAKGLAVLSKRIKKN